MSNGVKETGFHSALTQKTKTFALQSNTTQTMGRQLRDLY